MRGKFSVRGLCLKIYLASKLAREWLGNESLLCLCRAVCSTFCDLLRGTYLSEAALHVPHDSDQDLNLALRKLTCWTIPGRKPRSRKILPSGLLEAHGAGDGG